MTVLDRKIQDALVALSAVQLELGELDRNHDVNELALMRFQLARIAGKR